MAAAGVTVTEIDVAPFVKATEPVYDLLGYGELRKELMKVIAN